LYYRMIIALGLIIFLCERLYYTARQETAPALGFWKVIALVVFIIITVAYVLEHILGLL